MPLGAHNSQEYFQFKRAGAVVSIVGCSQKWSRSGMILPCRFHPAARERALSPRHLVPRRINDVDVP